MAQSGSKELTVSITLGEASFSASGPADLVREALDEFKEMASADAPSPRGGGSSTAGESAAKRPARRGGRPRVGKKSEEGEEKRDPIDASQVTLPQLLDEANLKSNPEIGAAIVIWAADHEKKAAMPAGEIETLWKGTTAKAPGNLSRDLGTAKRKGWISLNKDGYSPLGYGRSSLGFK